MVDLFFLFFFLLLSLSLLAFGLWRFQYSFVIFSGILFIVMGLFVFNGVHYVNGQNIVDYGNGNMTTLNNYTTFSGVFLYPTGFILAFLGLGLIFVAIYMLLKNKVAEYELNDDEGVHNE